MKVLMSDNREIRAEKIYIWPDGTATIHKPGKEKGEIVKTTEIEVIIKTGV